MRYPLDNFTVTQGYSSAHTGIDLAQPSGTPVKSPVTGTVIAVGTNPSYIGGRYVIVKEDGGNGYEYYTGHHNSTYVSVGQRVAEGQVIATVGATGQATGPHVHFQIRQSGGGALLNPTTVFNQYNKGGSPVIAGSGENWFARLNQLHIQTLGRPLGRDTFAQLVGKDTLTVMEIFSDHPEAQQAQRWQDVGKVAVTDKWDQQIYTLQAQLKDAQVALQNEQGKPPKEVIKEVIKIVEKPVEVIKEVPVYTHDKETKENVGKILNMTTSIFDYFKGQYKTFSKYIKKG